jgi:hypothetical protein
VKISTRGEPGVAGRAGLQFIVIRRNKFPRLSFRSKSEISFKADGKTANLHPAGNLMKFTAGRRKKATADSFAILAREDFVNNVSPSLSSLPAPVGGGNF